MLLFKVVGGQGYWHTDIFLQGDPNLSFIQITRVCTTQSKESHLQQCKNLLGVLSEGLQSHFAKTFKLPNIREH